MQKNIVKSISYLEFINNITLLVNDLLYAPQNGYLSWNSKDAVLNFDDVVKKFDIEAIKLAKNVNFSDVEMIIKSRKSSLIMAIQKHYEKQVLIWADEVFDDLIEHCLFELSIDKTKSQELYNQLINSADWIANIKKLNKTDYKNLLSELTNRFNNTLNSNDNDYIPLAPVEKSSVNDFCLLWNSIINDVDDFLNTDLADYSKKLSAKDFRYFENLKVKLKSNKKTSVIDEMTLISTALNVFHITENNDIYRFICEINDDFIDFSQQKKDFDEEEKVALIKRRAQLFTDKNNKSKKYFERLITS